MQRGRQCWHTARSEPCCARKNQAGRVACRGQKGSLAGLGVMSHSKTLRTMPSGYSLLWGKELTMCPAWPAYVCLEVEAG